MQSPRPTVSAMKQAFDVLCETKLKRVAHGSGPAFMATRSPVALWIIDVLANDGGVVTSRCVTRFH